MAQEDAAPLLLTRAQETELPLEVEIAFGDGGADYRRRTCVIPPSRRCPRAM